MNASFASVSHPNDNDSSHVSVASVPPSWFVPLSLVLSLVHIAANTTLLVKQKFSSSSLSSNGSCSLLDTKFLVNFDKILFI